MKPLLTNLASFVAIAALCVGATLLGLRLSGDRVTAEELQSKLIAACENGRAPLQVRFQFELDKSLAQNIKQLQDAFPQFPPEQIRESIKAERENLRSLLATYDPAACADQYR